MSILGELKKDGSVRVAVTDVTAGGNQIGSPAQVELPKR